MFYETGSDVAIISVPRWSSKEFTPVTTQTMPSGFVPFLRKCIQAAFKGKSLSVYRFKLKMFAAGVRHRDAVKGIQSAAPGTALQRALSERLQLMGLLVWPYQCATWDAKTRLARFQAHYAEVDRIGAPLNFATEDKVVLTTLDEMFPGLRVVLHQPLWLMREGGLTISLFENDMLLFSLTFSLFQDESGNRCALIGGCQGRNVDGIMDTYRDMTKALHGLRPRDFLMECFGILCRTINVKLTYAVSDKERHRRHPFFNQQGDFPQDYDVAWQERGGVATADGLFKFPENPARRDIEDIKPKKRSLYRKRYAFLEELEARITKDFATLTPIQFKEL